METIKVLETCWVHDEKNVIWHVRSVNAWASTNLHLGIWRMLQETNSHIYHLTQFWSTWDTRPENGNHWCKCERLCFKGAIPIFQRLEREADAPEWGGIFRADMSSGLKRRFTSSCLRGMLEEKEYHTLNILFPFVAGSSIVDLNLFNKGRWRRCILCIRTGFSNGIQERWNRRCCMDRRAEKNYKRAHTTSESPLNENCGPGLYMLKFQLLHLLIKDPERFGYLEVLDAS